MLLKLTPQHCWSWEATAPDEACMQHATFRKIDLKT